MTYVEAIQWIESVSGQGRQRGLSRMEELMHRLGDPQKQLRFVHVAGTNGKGSACAMLASILRRAGYRTGLYTSPHLQRYNERINIDGKDCSDREFAAAAGIVQQAALGMQEPPTEFETITAMAFVCFVAQHCDIVVLEVGLGGRIDATNVILQPEAAVIMNIGLEHTEYLGDTLEQIAWEKAGIIKPACQVAAYDVSLGVTAVYETVCRERQAKLHLARFWDIRVQESTVGRQVFSYGLYEDLQLPLTGSHQLKNAAVVLEAVQLLKARGWEIGEAAVREGLLAVQWPARMEVLSHEPLILLDGAHNPQCAAVLAESLQKLFLRKHIVFVTGVLRDKDYGAIMREVLPLASSFICLTPDSSRALPAESLRDWLSQRGARAFVCGSIEEGLAAACRQAGTEGLVVCFGSLYLAGAVREAVQRMAF